MLRNKIHFDFRKENAIQAVMWFLSRHGYRLDQMKALKLMYLADKAHLAKYGRPIAGGSYYAMRYGPVCSELYDLFKDPSGIPFHLEDNFLKADECEYEEDCLSESDKEILSEINEKFGSKDPFSLSSYTHELPEYKNIWDENRKEGRKKIDYESIINDEEMKEIIVDDQSAWDF
ncbi:putative phage-associated protein [Sedimentisphaera cyanobacteriorum]|uniref:Putative phage-associated protein n=1 Tax=Sedimentisphaera cyanobacteriorum TaxID=1940790 RepID=A0A1Q2HRE6_9BACT|nr:Panacea domain-containing protein [Sedimentisphaera cyanobacteriorum]AQQ09805.1 putative phage-associated protein [Sedimentisphaera cyanobacteriorum]